MHENPREMEPPRLAARPSTSSTSDLAARRPALGLAARRPAFGLAAHRRVLQPPRFPLNEGAPPRKRARFDAPTTPAADDAAPAPPAASSAAARRPPPTRAPSAAVDAAAPDAPAEAPAAAPAAAPAETLAAQLEALELPDAARLATRYGIDRLYAWQVSALRTGRALAGGNLVYAAPASGGKTTVAEVLIAKALWRVRARGRLALYVVRRRR